MNTKLYLIPVPLHPQSPELAPESTKVILKELRLFIVEDVRSAQQFLKKCIPGFPMTASEFLVFNEHSQPAQARDIVQKITEQNAGLLSEAGVPCVADPGNEVVALAHQKNIDVVSLPGSSSIILALMASGMNGQKFAFHGYLPKEKDERGRKLHFLEQTSARDEQTQIFMEAPYRNQKLLEELLVTLNPKTLLCVAADLTAPTQTVKTMTVERWKAQKSFILDNRPALFLIQKKMK